MCAELSTLFHRLIDFLRAITLNFVDLNRVSSAIEVLTGDVESEFRENVIVDLTSRFTTYKKILFKSIGEGGKIKANSINSGEEGLQLATTYINKVQEDKYFSLVYKYVRCGLRIEDSYPKTNDKNSFIYSSLRRCERRVL